MSAPAGWYPHPSAQGHELWWDGRAWSDRVRVAHASGDAVGPRPVAPDAWNTVWIWLIAAAPAVSGLSSLLVPWGQAFDGMTVPTAQHPMSGMSPLFTSPLYLAVSALGFVLLALSLWWAFLDQRALASRGVVRPFPWGWSVLSLVYPIGRSVVVHRRTGRGWAPLWATLAGLLVSVACTAVIVAEMGGSLMASVQQLPR